MNDLLKEYGGDRAQVKQEVRLITDNPEDLENVTDAIVAARALFRVTAFHRNPAAKDAVRSLMSAMHVNTGDFLKDRPLEIAGIVSGPDSKVTMKADS